MNVTRDILSQVALPARSGEHQVGKFRKVTLELLRSYLAENNVDKGQLSIFIHEDVILPWIRKVISPVGRQPNFVVWVKEPEFPFFKRSTYLYRECQHFRSGNNKRLKQEWLYTARSRDHANYFESCIGEVF